MERFIIINGRQLDRVSDTPQKIHRSLGGQLFKVERFKHGICGLCENVFLSLTYKDIKAAFKRGQLSEKDVRYLLPTMPRDFV